MASVKENQQIAAFLGRIDGQAEQRQKMIALSELGRIHRRKHPDGRPFAPTSNRRLISEYRNAIRERWGDSAPVLAWLRYSNNRTEEYKTHQREQRQHRHENQRPITPARHIATAVTVLEHALLVEWSIPRAIAAVIALTGRRPYEVACTGTFEPEPDTDAGVLFSGQAKTRDHERALESYTFPALGGRQEVIDAVTRLRTAIDPSMPNRAFSQRWAKEIGTWSKRYFRDDAGVPILPRELREAYAAIAYEQFAKPGTSAVAYYNKVLGHQSLDFDTSLFYFDFYIPRNGAAAS